MVNNYLRGLVKVEMWKVVWWLKGWEEIDLEVDVMFLKEGLRVWLKKNLDSVY